MDIAESRCAEIKREIESYYLKTCQVYCDEHSISVHGVACQTDDAELGFPSVDSEKMPDIKLKIALPKRKRGRPVKAQTPKKTDAGNDQVRRMLINRVTKRQILSNFGFKIEFCGGERSAVHREAKKKG